MQYLTCTKIDKIFGFKNSFLFISVNCDSNTSCHEQFYQLPQFYRGQPVSNITKLLKYILYQTFNFKIGNLGTVDAPPPP